MWKEEYEAHVAEWRRQSAEQRQKAEEKRAEWEAIREQERKEGNSDPFNDALDDDSVEVQVSEVDRDPYGIMIAKAEL